MAVAASDRMSADFASYDLIGLNELVRLHGVRAEEVLEACIAAIERDNKRLNAVVTTLYDQARQQLADQPPGALFAGLPFLLKDLGAHCAGTPLTSGARYARNYVSSRDTELVARYRRAGLLFVGKTNTPELGLLPVTEGRHLGTARNPWDVSRTPGGSSGGAGAAVAAGFVPAAHGGDGGGSIRIPASCNGLFGLKPTRGRVPMGPFVGDIWQGAVVEHALTRSVRDSAMLLDAVAGPDVGAPYFAPPPEEPFSVALKRPCRRLRIARSLATLTGVPVHDECRKAVDLAARLCRDLGHDVVDADPPVADPGLIAAFLTMLAAETAAEVQAMVRLIGRPPAFDDFEVPTRLLCLIARAISAEELAVASRRLKFLSREIGGFFEDHDILLTPTLAQPPLKIGALDPPGWERVAQIVLARMRAGRVLKAVDALGVSAARVFSFIPFTPIANITGQPSMSVPLHWSADGLPVGTMFTGRFGDEATLFQLAAQLEREVPWFNRRPATTTAKKGIQE
jgi:amidase